MKATVLVEACKQKRLFKDYKDPLFGETVYHSAFTDENWESFKEFYQEGFDLTIKNNFGISVYDRFLQRKDDEYEDVEMVKFFEKYLKRKHVDDHKSGVWRLQPMHKVSFERKAFIIQKAELVRGVCNSELTEE
jgi:hypothetical protein